MSRTFKADYCRWYGTCRGCGREVSITMEIQGSTADPKRVKCASCGTTNHLSQTEPVGL